jgi:hypothetical protein
LFLVRHHRFSQELAMSLKSLELEAAAYRRRDRVGPFPAALRARITVAMRDMRSAGQTYGRIAGAFRVDPATVRAWLSSKPEARLLPVVVKSPATGSSAQPSLSPMVLLSPSGWRVEGLTVDALIAIVSRC